MSVRATTGLTGFSSRGPGSVRRAIAGGVQQDVATHAAATVIIAG